MSPNRRPGYLSEDPTGRLRVGMLARMRRNGHIPNMIVDGFCAPRGLYLRPVREDDDEALKEVAENLLAACPDLKRGGPILSCKPDAEGAVFAPERIMVFIKYSHDEAPTTISADVIEPFWFE